MSSFELTFLVQGEVTDEQQEILLVTFDEITVAIDPHDRCTITGLFTGQTAVSAACRAIDQLHRLGFTVDRMQEDLVDRGEIAARAGISRQAVGHWVSRTHERPFPAPVHSVPGPVWLWGEVVRWMLATGRVYDTHDTDWPDQIDHDIVNGELARLDHNEPWAALPVPAGQRWFRAERWQEREREVDEHVTAGRLAVHESAEDFLGHLDELDSE